MSISKSRYVLITSGVGGPAVVARRELIARLMTTNELVATNGVLEFGGGSATAISSCLRSSSGLLKNVYILRYIAVVNPLCCKASGIS